MSELPKLGIDPESLNFEITPDLARVMDYEDQIATATIAAWGNFWPNRQMKTVKQSGLFHQIATTAAEVTTILGMKSLPKLGLLNGMMHGKLNYLGYCWDDEDGQVWVGFDESWISAVADTIRSNSDVIPEFLYNQLNFVLAEEIFHAFTWEINPEVAKQNAKANDSDDPVQYWNSLGELASKEFALLYVSHKGK